MNILDILFPKRCLTCGRFGKYFCDRCAETIKTIEPRETICPVCERSAIGGVTHPRCVMRYSLDGLTSIFHYDGIIREAVKTLKYRLVTDLAKGFVSLVPLSSFYQVTKLLTNQLTFLVPIPLHSSRFRDRGFNQTEVLGRLLADRLQIPMRTDILKRVIKTTPQVEMKDRKERLKNMKNVFSIHNSKFIIHNSTMLLFDDVFTTGATMRAAGETLKRAGGKVVWAVTMAR
ncbi:ComF family protein [Candidatus Gottesmanbacteria bacterium]|nr:ComF family protein [Candidatus Gottesmanbacteria bacterium]